MTYKRQTQEGHTGHDKGTVNGMDSWNELRTMMVRARIADRLAESHGRRLAATAHASRDALRHGSGGSAGVGGAGRARAILGRWFAAGSAERARSVGRSAVELGRGTQAPLGLLNR